MSSTVTKGRSIWRAFSSTNAAPQKTSPLNIAAAGLCCAVGYTLDAAACAMRANMDHFQQSEFQTPQRDKVLVSRLDDADIWGKSRLARWITLSISECLSKAGEPDTTAIPLIWLAPEQGRRGGDADWYLDVFTQAIEQLGKQFHPSSGVLPLGRAGLSSALQQANDMLQEPDCRQVLIVGADTFLTATTINAYLHAERLQVPGNSDGFIPGEAAAALLLERSDDAPTVDGAGTLASAPVQICGYGAGNETGRPDGSEPSRAQGLTQALRAALAASPFSYADLDFRMSDQNGEAFFAREAANALTRLAPVGGEQLSLLTTADCLGEIGAATGPAMLAYLSRQMPHRASPGSTGLLHLANDDGLRCAVVLHHPST